jgi:hypothetical protein
VSRRRPLLSLLAVLGALAACHKPASGPAFRLAEPSAVAVVRAYGHLHADRLWSYGFVANTERNELIVFDAVEDRVVPAPILLRPLSISTPDPLPALVASAEFWEASDPVDAPSPRPGLLVVVSAGATQLQLVRTWLDASQTDPGLPADPPVDLGGQVLAMVATPAVDGAGAKLADRVRVVAALTDGRLAVVEYEWSGDPASSDPGTGGKVTRVGTGPAALQDVGFNALSLAVDPRDPRYLFAASVDEIAVGVEGVARIDMSGSVGAWSVAALDAGGPTRLVAALTLSERKADKSGTYDQVSSTDGDPATAFEATEVHRVYAWRDPSSCGPTQALPCGIAVLDRDSGGLAAPAFLGGETFPITVPSRPVALIAGTPSLHPPAESTLENADGGPYAGIQARNWRTTTGVLAIPCEDGRVYWADLARWEVPSSDYEVNGSATSTGVSSITPSLSTSRRLGLYLPKFLDDGAARALWSADTAAASYVQVTPGFTPSETWTVTYQGYLPDFATSRAAEITDAGDGRLRVALQFHSPETVSPTQVVDVYDPARGVHVGDIVEIWTGPARLNPSDAREALLCPDTTTTVNGEDVQPIEGKVVSIDAADGAHPGGSLVIEPGDCVSILLGTRTLCDAATHGPWTSKPGCWAALPTLLASATSTAGAFPVRIRAGGGAPGAEEFVVVGAKVGYAGRAVSTRVTPPVETPAFTFTSEDLPAREAACPLMQPSPPATCDGACRDACERAAIARRARRTHLTSVTCHGDDAAADKSFCQRHFSGFDRTLKTATEPFPPPVGPTLAFSLALSCPPDDQEGCVDTQNTTSTKALIRDAKLAFTTRSGWTPSSRWGGGGNSGPGTLPMGGAFFDRSADTSWGKQGDRYRFFVPYVDNMVLDITPSKSNGSTRIMR